MQSNTTNQGTREGNFGHLSSPQNQNLFSARNSTSGLMLQSFVDRLVTRERVNKISGELRTLEKLIWVHIAEDFPDLYR